MLLVLQTAEAASNVVWLCYVCVLSFLSFSLLVGDMSSCVGGWPACSWWFLFCLFVFGLPVAFPPGGHDLVAYPSCLRLGDGVGSSPLCSSLAIRIFSRGVCLLFSFSVHILLSFFSLYFILFFLLVCLGCWRTYVVPVVSSTMAWRYIVYSLYCITMWYLP